jgi:hypothetical protein
MKNLEKYGVQVLDAREIREVDGGFICGGLCLTLIGTAIGVLLTQDLGDLADAFNEGREAAK